MFLCLKYIDFCSYHTYWFCLFLWKKIDVIVDIQNLSSTNYIILEDTMSQQFEEIMCQQYLVVLSFLFMVIHCHSLRRRQRNRHEVRYHMSVWISKIISQFNFIINDSDIVCVEKIRMDRNSFHTIVLLTKDVRGLTDGKYMFVVKR